MLSKHYELTEVDRRPRLNVHSATLWSTISVIHQVVDHKIYSTKILSDTFSIVVGVFKTV